jgi:AcrR family transcriptional regulator
MKVNRAMRETWYEATSRANTFSSNENEDSVAQRTAVAIGTSAGNRNKRSAARKAGPMRAGARRGDATRQVILDAAEQCLAAGDFDGVSLRTISEAAGVDIALVNYHFGSKESLVEEVTERRARDVHDARVLALEEARHRAGTAPPDVDAVVTAFLEPWLKRISSGDVGWQNYNRLLCRLTMMPKYLPLVSKLLDPTALHFINALRAALPKASQESIYWGYMFLLGAVVQIMAGTGRIEQLSRGLCTTDDINAAMREIVPFVCHGLRSLERTDIAV